MVELTLNNLKQIGAPVLHIESAIVTNPSPMNYTHSNLGTAATVKTHSNSGLLITKPIQLPQNGALLAEAANATRAEQRKQRLLEMEMELAREEDEALKITEEQRQTLLHPFRAVKAEFSDLDGLRWSQDALRFFQKDNQNCDKIDNRPSIAPSSSANGYMPTPSLPKEDLDAYSTEDTIRISSYSTNGPSETQFQPPGRTFLFPSGSSTSPPTITSVTALADISSATITNGNRKRDGTRSRSPVKGLFPTQSVSEHGVVISSASPEELDLESESSNLTTHSTQLCLRIERSQAPHQNNGDLGSSESQINLEPAPHSPFPSLPLSSSSSSSTDSDLLPNGSKFGPDPYSPGEVRHLGLGRGIADTGSSHLTFEKNGANHLRASIFGFGRSRSPLLFSPTESPGTIINVPNSKLRSKSSNNVAVYFSELKRDIEDETPTHSPNSPVTARPSPRASLDSVRDEDWGVKTRGASQSDAAPHEDLSNSIQRGRTRHPGHRRNSDSVVVEGLAEDWDANREGAGSPSMKWIRAFHQAS